MPDRDELKAILSKFGVQITDTLHWLAPADRVPENDPYRNDVVISGPDGAVAQFRFDDAGHFLSLNISEGLVG